MRRTDLSSRIARAVTPSTPSTIPDVSVIIRSISITVMTILDSGALSSDKTVRHRQSAPRSTAIYPIWASTQNSAIRQRTQADRLDVPVSDAGLVLQPGQRVGAPSAIITSAGSCPAVISRTCRSSRSMPAGRTGTPAPRGPPRPPSVRPLHARRPPSRPPEHKPSRKLTARVFLRGAARPRIWPGLGLQRAGRDSHQGSGPGGGLPPTTRPPRCERDLHYRSAWPTVARY